jgi:serine/threonine protein kinase
MLTPNTLLQGRYLIVRQLGQGGMGAVYEAIDQRLDTTVALKETLFTDEKLRKQFEREARLLARLHHPALPRVSDHFSEGDGQFLVMQFIPGDDLAEMMARKKGPFPTDQVVTWADQLLDALDYLHTQEPQIVHRDIKPQNLKLTPRGQIILLDFGLAKGQGGDISRVTSASIFGYTPNYAPLEQIQGLGTDSRSDLYSLAATVYHLMTGIKPPDALTRAAALVNGQPDPLIMPSEANSAIGPEVDVLISKAMAQNREQRYPNAAEMRRALQGTEQAATVISRGEAQTVLFPPSAPGTVAANTKTVEKQRTVKAGETTVVRNPMSASRKRVMPWAVAGAALLVVVCGVFGIHSWRSREVLQVQVTPEPTPGAPVSSPSATPTPSQSPTENKASAEATPANKKTERSQRNEDKKTVITVETPAAPNPPQETSQEHESTKPPDAKAPKGPVIVGPRPNIRTQEMPGTRVTPGGVVIRTMPDGSQLITMPDGTRVFKDPKGKSRVLEPGRRPNPNRQPKNSPSPSP